MEDGRNGKWVEERAGQLVVADLSSELLGWINSAGMFSDHPNPAVMMDCRPPRSGYPGSLVALQGSV